MVFFIPTFLHNQFLEEGEQTIVMELKHHIVIQDSEYRDCSVLVFKL